MNEQRNLIVAIVLSAVVLFGFQWLFPTPEPPAPKPPQEQQAADTTPPAASTPPASADTSPPQATPGTESAPPATTPPGGPGTTVPRGESRSAALKIAGPRVPIKTPNITGSVALKGARLDDVVLSHYRETTDPDSPHIVLFSPTGAPKPYFAEQGWAPAPGSGQPVPTAETVWTAEGDTLTPDTPLVLTWDNGEGLVFKRTIAVDTGFLFTITQSVTNNSDQPVTLYPYSLVSRTGTPETSGFFILHEGPIGVLDDSLDEKSYRTVRDDHEITEPSQGGWLGFTDKYWLAAVIAPGGQEIKTRFSYQQTGAGRYQADYLGTRGVTVPPGATEENVGRLFAGAKQVTLLDKYSKEFDIPHFDRAVDFGWFYFLTKPFFYVLHWLYSLLGNFGLAIIAFTILVKLALFPLANKSYRSMNRMKQLQPEMKKLQERFKEDRQRMNQELMALYRREKVNPVSGCLPIVVQIPVFFALYKVLFVSLEMRQAPFFGWIKDLSQLDPTNIFNLFGLLPFTPPDFLHIGIWPLIMGGSMYLQQKLNPQPTDPTQARIMMMLPVIFTFLLARFPAGLVIYWATNNILSIAQQWWIMRQMNKSAPAAKD